MSTSEQLLTQAFTRIMKPLIRIMLKHGISFDAFSELLKSLFVEVAQSEFALDGKKQTISRISTITGLTRKEVKKALETNEIDLSSLTQQYNRAARVISGWVRDKEFHTPRGQPAALVIDANGPSFKSLVQRYSGDIPPRAILDELTRVGAVEVTAQKKLKLLQRAYIPEKNMDEKIRILGTDVNDLIETIYHNTYINSEKPFFQRKVSYNAIPKKVINELKDSLRTKAQSCLEDMDKLMVKHDSDNNKTLDNDENTRAGVGIYYFEEPDYV